jgi:hypothetical protein
MIRLFWAALFGVVEIFCLYSLIYFTSKSLPTIKPKRYITKHANEPHKIEEWDYDPEMEHQMQTKKNGYNTGSTVFVVPVSSNFSMNTNSPQRLHWYHIFSKEIKMKNVWMPSFAVFSYIWALFNGIALVGIFIFWWQSNETPDFPPIEQFTNNYDLVLLLAIISRFLISSWIMMFWGSIGDIWWLRIAFCEILGSLALGITALVYMFSINTLAFGFYCAYVVWQLFVLYYTGVFLKTCYDIRTLNKKPYSFYFYF